MIENATITELNGRIYVSANEGYVLTNWNEGDEVHRFFFMSSAIVHYGEERGLRAITKERAEVMEQEKNEYITNKDKENGNENV